MKKLSSFKEATKKIKENYQASLIVKASEFSMQELDDNDMQEIEHLINQLTPKTANLVYSQFITQISSKGVASDSDKWLEKIFSKSLPSFVFIQQSPGKAFEFDKIKNRIDFPFPLKKEAFSSNLNSQNPFVLILTKTAKEEASFFFPMYKKLLHVMIEKTKLEPKDLSWCIQDILEVDGLYPKEVVKKLIIKHLPNLDDEIKEEIALTILEKEAGGNIYRQYKSILDNGIENNNSKTVELLKLLNHEALYIDSAKMSKFLFPVSLYVQDRCMVHYPISSLTLIKFIKSVNLNEQEVKNFFFDNKRVLKDENVSSMGLKSMIKELKNPNKNLIWHDIMNNSFEMLKNYNLIAKQQNFTPYSIGSPHSPEERITVLEKIVLDISLSDNKVSKKLKI